MSDDKPVIVIKKKGGHGGHHGGAWKVAYADFVTAMMAFFMVMWLLNSADQTTKQNIASYFKRPGIFHEGSGTPLLIGEAGILEDAYVPPRPEEKLLATGTNQSPLIARTGTEDDASLPQRVSPSGLDERGIVAGNAASHGYHDQRTELQYSGMTDPGRSSVGKDEKALEVEGIRQQAMQRLAERIRDQIRQFPELQQLLGVVDVNLQADGLNIEIMDTDKTSMFKSGSDEIEPPAREAFSKLATILADVPNTIEIVGHTDAIPFAGRKDGYSNWELSSDRANTARRLLESEGIAPERIVGVIGKASRQPRNKGNPFHHSNRRITLKMRFHEDLLIDLSKNPDGLKDIKLDDPLLQPEQVDEKVHAFGVDQMERPAPPRQGDEIPLPPEQEAHPAQVPFERHRILERNPVLGPPDPFSGF